MPVSDLSVSLEAVLEATAEQRNAALNDVAQLRAVVKQLVGERDQALAELEQLRDAQSVPDEPDAG